MNKEELTTLLTPQGTSHCDCLEHCFLFGYCVASASSVDLLWIRNQDRRTQLSHTLGT